MPATKILVIPAFFLLINTICACAPTTPDTGDEPTFEDVPGLLIATVAGDFASGTLASYIPTKTELNDGLFTLSGEGRLSELDGKIALVESTPTNSLSVFERSDLSTPIVQVSTGEGSNPVAVVSCGDSWWVALYDGVGLLQLDPQTGAERNTIDLSELDPSGDGLPEIGSLLVHDGRLFVTAEIFDRPAGWTNPGFGYVVELDCATGNEVERWTVGASPSLRSNPADPAGFLLTEGLWYDENWLTLADGRLLAFDPDQGPSTAGLMDEATFGGNFDGLLITQAGTGILQVSKDDTFERWCFDLSTGATTLLDSAMNWWTDMSSTEAGLFAAVRPSWLDPQAPSGIAQLQINGCTSTMLPSAATDLPPYSLLAIELQVETNTNDGQGLP